MSRVIKFKEESQEVKGFSIGVHQDFNHNRKAGEWLSEDYEEKLPQVKIFIRPDSLEFSWTDRYNRDFCNRVTLNQSWIGFKDECNNTLSGLRKYFR